MPMKNVGNSSDGRSQGVQKISGHPCIGRMGALHGHLCDSTAFLFGDAVKKGPTRQIGLRAHLGHGPPLVRLSYSRRYATPCVRLDITFLSSFVIRLSNPNVFGLLPGNSLITLRSP